MSSKLARGDGTSHIEIVPASEWLGLNLVSWNGHDLAVPTNVEQGVLNLRWQFKDYVDGLVQTNVLPTVWPDPHFPVSQVRKIWPALEQDRKPASRSGRTTIRAQTRCESWLREIGEDNIGKKPKPDWRSEAIAKFPGLCGCGFDQAWANVANEFPSISRARAKPKNKELNHCAKNYSAEL